MGREAKGKNATCWRCRAVRVRGRWAHGAALSVPADICLPAMLCPACKAIRMHEAGHVLTIEGFPMERLRELAAIIRNAAGAETAMRCEERLVFVRRAGDRIAVGTTGKHLARRIGSAVERACKKDLRVVRRDEAATALVWGRADALSARKVVRRGAR